MRILVIGGTRGIGRATVIQALERGHGLRVLARRQPRLPTRRSWRSAVDLQLGDARDAATMADAVADRDAVIVAVGTVPTLRTVTLFSSSIGNVIAAMRRAGVARLVYVTGVGAGDSRGHGGFWFDRIIQPLLLRRIYEDKDRSESMVRASQLDWTIVRPALLTNGPITTRYRIINAVHHISATNIARGDVAHFMLDELERNEFVGRTPLLTY